MRPIRTVLIFLVAVFVFGALIAPWLYWGVQSLAHSWPWLESLARKPFHLFVNRSLLGLAIIGLWPMARLLEIRSWSELGIRSSPQAKRQLLQGLLLGFGSLAIVAILALLNGARKWNSDLALSALGTRVLSATTSAAVVAMIEEVLFRGAFFGALRKKHHWMTALLISSAIYAWVHFFRRPPSPPVVTWSSGFEVLGQMLHGFVELNSLIPGFFVLLLAGIILGLGFQKTNMLWFSIGTHAGWIFWLKLYGTLTIELPGPNRLLWGSSKLIDGWLAAGVLLLAAFAQLDVFKSRKSYAKPA